ncbi:alanine--tRNA ligase [Caldicellulosiruptoraceae bacterium PP1]
MFMSANEIREKYLSFFESKGHLRLPSFSLIPKNDKSLLLINAGMAPLKQYFLGIEEPPKKRITTCQKCIRTPDIERVGKTARHATFFEMLGNFSFGDYFKREAITWAWEFVTEVLKLPKDRLWVTIYQDDNEAFDIWYNEIGVEAERIVRMGKEDNFWEIGTGPCGPCSEIYYDRGPEKGCGKETCGIGCDCDRYVEFWNLVFTQFDKDENGNYNKLKNPNIDTGMGLERIAAIMQGVDSLFDIDTVKYIRDRVCEIANVKYGDSKEVDVSIRVITDHIRGSSFMITDGILPSNEGRGYVLRRLIRRASRHGRLLGIKSAFLHEVVDAVVEMFKGAYPELENRKEYIKKVLFNEESRFLKTIDNGLELLEQEIENIKKSKTSILSSEVVFKLYDTYGFPIDLTKEIAAENNLVVDEEGFNLLMEKQKERSREARKDLENVGWKETSFDFEDLPPTEFLGYNTLYTNANIIKIFSENEEVSKLEEGNEGILILNKTTFYAESGGQLADKGIIKTPFATCIVTDVKKGPKGVILHYVKVLNGWIEINMQVETIVDEGKRKSTSRNHTATHLLHKALRTILGEHATQSGSLVSDERLRFDFTHYQPLTNEQIKEIENIVNRVILSAIDIEKIETDLNSAIKMGATALFDEKYSNNVRVIKVSDFSMELCGGTHVDNTGEIGLFKIISEGSVSAGIRRIEAITGEKVFNLLVNYENILDQLKNNLKVNSYDEITKKITMLEEKIEEYEDKIKYYKLLQIEQYIEDISKNKEVINNFNIYLLKTDTYDIETTKLIIDRIKEKDSKGIIISFVIAEEKITVIIASTKETVKRGVNCGKLVQQVSEILGGKGGGRPDFAQGGGKEKDKINDAINYVKKQISNLLQ